MDDVQRARQAFTNWQDAVCNDWYADDPHLRSLVAHHGYASHARALSLFGPISAQVIDPLVRENNRDEHLPRLRRYDGLGNRIESVDFHPSYHHIGRLGYGTGIMSRYAEPGREFETLSLLYLLAQNGEGGHTCPMACTAGLIKLLQRDGGHEAWLSKLLDADYDQHFHGAQFLTEVQGGSDVGANAVRATPDGDHWRITGEKWFCSVIDADLFLVTARIDGGPDGTRGLGAFVVPRLLADGSTNAFSVRRLKFKMGTRSMASGETDFNGAWAVRVGDFKATVEVVLNTSRLYNAICSAGCLQRATREAHHYADTRLAFGQPILKFPSVARIIARLRAETYAIRSVTFLLASMADQKAKGNNDPTLVGAYRMLVNLNKYWTSVQATLGIRDAIEILGGNGAIEEFTVLPRLLRDSIVCEAWEGGHNVLCAQLLRDSQRFGLHQPMFALLRRLGGDVERIAELEARWERLLAGPPEYGAAHIRDVADALRVVAQCAALRAEMKTHGSDPLLPTVIHHLETLNAPGWNPMDDDGLMERVAALSQRPHRPA